MDDNKQLQNTKEAEEEKSQARCDYEEGQTFLEKDDHSQAANAFHNALLGFQQDKDEVGIANASDKLGDICCQIGKYEQALSHWEESYTICAKMNDRMSVFSIEKKRAKLYWMWKKYDQAIDLYMEIIDEYSGNQNPQGTVETLETMSEIYLEKGDKEKAVDCLRTIASIHKNFKHTNFASRFTEKADKLERGE